MIEFAPTWAWEILGIDGSADERAIKRAYSRLLKLKRPEDNAAAFQALHQAYQTSLQYAAGAKQALEQAQEQDWIGVAEKTASAVDLTPAPATLSQAPAAAATTRMAHDAGRLAETLWKNFLGFPADAINEQFDGLTKLLQSESFATRDALELLALNLAADPACSPDFRARLARAFDWDSDSAMTHMMRAAPHLAPMAAAQLRADRGLEILQGEQVHDKALPYLLAPALPRKLALMRDQSFHRAMRARVENLAWQYPDVIEHRLVPEVFAGWQSYATSTPYFVQTGMKSFAAGVVLFFLIQWPLTLGLSGLLALFVACVAGCMGLVALLILHPPRMVIDAWTHFRHAWLDKVLHETRHAPRWQYGWLGPFALLSLLLAIPTQGGVATALLGAGFAACAVVALFAASAMIAITRISVALIGAAVCSACMITFGFENAICASTGFSICLLLLAAQPGDLLYAQLNFQARARLHARLAWLVSLPLFYIISAMLLLPIPATYALAMLLLVAGVILARVMFMQWMTWPGLLLVKFLVFSTNSPILAGTQPRAHFLIVMLVITAVFMVTNMLMDETD